MKASIEINSGSYGFGHEWTLVLIKTSGARKAFYLGQDGKFCRRVLGMPPAYIVEQIGSPNITEPEINTKLANFIINRLGLTKNELFKLSESELCAQ